jgi:hypothetical protein
MSTRRCPAAVLQLTVSVLAAAAVLLLHSLTNTGPGNGVGVGGTGVGVGGTGVDVGGIGVGVGGIGVGVGAEVGVTVLLQSARYVTILIRSGLVLV